MRRLVDIRLRCKEQDDCAQPTGSNTSQAVASNLHSTHIKLLLRGIRTTQLLR
jgi:hypothetical protein